MAKQTRTASPTCGRAHIRHPALRRISAFRIGFSCPRRISFCKAQSIRNAQGVAAHKSTLEVIRCHSLNGIHASAQLIAAVIGIGRSRVSSVNSASQICESFHPDLNTFWYVKIREDQIHLIFDFLRKIETQKDYYNEYIHHKQQIR